MAEYLKKAVPKPAADRTDLEQKVRRMLDDIAAKCGSARPVLAILFRQDRLLEQPWPRRELEAAGVLHGSPQSITQVNSEEGRRWLQERLHELP